VTSGGRVRLLVPSAPAIALAVGVLTFGCAAPALTDRPVSGSQSPEVVVTAATPGPTRRPAHDYQGMQRQLRDELSKGDPDLKLVRSVLVSVDGRTTISYFNKRRPTDHAHVWSVTKSVISILVGIAVDEGRLRLDQTLQELLPQQASSMTLQQASITLRQLLTMTAGISGDHGALNLTADDTVSQILSYPMGTDPGVAFEYSNSSAHLVAAVLRNAVDRPILDYARANLFDPLGIDTRPAWQGWDTRSPTSGFNKPGFGWAADSAGINVGAIGLKLTAADLVKLGELYINGGRWHGRQIVSQAWVDESTSAQLSADQQYPSQGQYGYLWSAGEYEGHTAFLASGSYYQKIFCFPESDVVVVVTAADDLTRPDTLDLTLDPVLEKVIFSPLLQ
jgi:CubicO group peptidase (beta-lactamase class C family)